MDSAGAERVRVRCECGVKLKVAPSLIGRTIKCPKCGVSFQAESDEEPLAIAPMDWEDAVDSAKKSAAPPPPPKRGDGPPCPLCGTAQSAGAVICVQCGYDKRSGKRIGGQTEAVKKVSRFAKLAGTFLMGCGLSAVGAGVGATVWFLIAIFTGFEIGWIAWGVGILAGTGMYFGAQERSARTGVVAAIIAFVGIVLGKAAVFVFVLYTMITGDTDDIELLRLHVQQRITDDDLNNKGVFDEDERDKQWDTAWESAGKKVAKMTEAEVRTRTDGYRAEQVRLEEKSSEVGLLRSRLAWHDAELKAEAEGLSWNDEKRTRIFERVDSDMERLGEVEVRERIAKLEAWEKEDRWKDENYVRDRLTYRKIESEILASPPADADVAADLEPDEWDLPEKAWKPIYNRVAAQVRELSADQRLEELKKIEIDKEDRDMREQLIGHFSTLAADQAGLFFGDEQAHEAIAAEQRKRFENHTHDQLVSDVAAMNAWEKEGKWSDAPYLRVELISQFTRKEVDLRREVERTKNSDEYWTPTADEWKKFHEQSAKTVDAIPPDQHAAKIRTMEEERRQEMDDLFAARASEESAAVMTGLIGAFASTLIAPMNILFFILGLSSAYRIASRGFEKN